MIVKCQFKLKSSDGYGGREYTYLTDLPLKVGDIVRVPAGDSEGIARVSEINVPEISVRSDLFPLLKHVIGYSDYDENLIDGGQEAQVPALPESEIPADIIVIQQLPVIEEHIRSLQPIIEEKVNEAMALAVTEDTSAAVRKVKAALGKDRDSFKDSVKKVIDAVSAPLIPIKEARDEILKIYEKADKDLSAKINAVDDGVKDEKRKQLRAYYEEYRQSKNLDQEEMADFDRRAWNVRKSDSLTALKKTAEEHLNKIAGDLISIRTMPYPDEILVEYRLLGDLARATANVNERHRLAEEQRKRREAAEAERAEREAREREAVEKVKAAIQNAAPLEPPVQKPAKDPNELFPVVGPFVLINVTRAQVIKFKQFLNQEGIKYGKP